MELPFQHNLRFTNTGPIKLSDLGQTLIAHEIAFALLPMILEKTIPGLIVDKFSYELAKFSQAVHLKKISPNILSSVCKNP